MHDMNNTKYMRYVGFTFRRRPIV